MWVWLIGRKGLVGVSLRAKKKKKKKKASEKKRNREKSGKELQAWWRVERMGCCEEHGFYGYLGEIWRKMIGQ